MRLASFGAAAEGVAVVEHSGVVGLPAATAAAVGVALVVAALVSAVLPPLLQARTRRTERLAALVKTGFSAQEAQALVRAVPVELVGRAETGVQVVMVGPLSPAQVQSLLQAELPRPEKPSM